MENESTFRARRDDGLSLIELLISITVLAVLSATLSAVIITALRTTPPTEARVDDARGLQGLVTWLPEDVDAAAPDGFDRDPAAWPCAGAAPADSTNVLAIEWIEHSTATNQFAATYRYEKSGDTWNIVRYSCTNSGPGERVNLTSDLPPWTPGAAYTIMCAVVVDAAYDGNCPAADTYPASDYAPVSVKSLKLKVDLANGLKVTIDAAPKNPDASLADDPDAGANVAPTVQNLAINLSLATNQTVVYDLAPYLGAVTDPDGDDTAMTVSIDPTEPRPSNLVSATTAYNGPTQFELTLTAGSTPGTAVEPLMLIVSDERGGWKVVRATITVTPPPNVAPWLDATDPDTKVIALAADSGVTMLDVPGLFNVQDDRPLTELTVAITAVTTLPPPLDVDPSDYDLTPMGHELEIDFDSDMASSVGGEIYVDLTVTDASGAPLVLHLTIQVLPPSTPNHAPVAPVGNVGVTIEAGQSASLDVTAISAHGAYDIDVGDDLSASIVSSPTGITASTSDTAVTLAVDPAAPVGVATPVVVRISDIVGAYVDVTVTVTVTAPPPPPSDCVLGGLSLNPGSTIARQGGGTSPRQLEQDLIVTLSYSGTCDGLRLNYDSGDPTGLGTGVGRVFPPGNPTSITIVGHFSGGTEKFSPGSHLLTATTSSAVAVTSVSTYLNVT